MSFKNIVVAGGGVLGSQIAYQIAFKGFNVTMWLRSDASIDRAKPKLEGVNNLYLKTLNDLKGDCKQAAYQLGGMIDDPANLTNDVIEKLEKDAADAMSKIKLTTDMEEAVKDADFVIESIAEDPKMKAEFYTKLSTILPEKTIVATNSSTMLPSHFAKYTGRPEKYLAMHFLNQIWSINIAEIMGHSETSKEAFDQVVEFSKNISMVPLELKKEQPGYIFNSMLVPFLNAAQALWANEVADPQTIDKTWVKGTGSKLGPFQVLDVVGLVTACNIVKMSPDAADPNSIAGKIAGKLEGLISEGKTGIAAGEGFYKYK